MKDLFIPSDLRPDVTSFVGDTIYRADYVALTSLPEVESYPGSMLSGCGESSGKEGTSDGKEGTSDGKEDSSRNPDLRILPADLVAMPTDLRAKFAPIKMATRVAQPAIR